jgi:hypothetical protein
MCLTYSPAPTDNVGMRRRAALSEVLTRHQTACPRCKCPEAVVLLDALFEVQWQCVDCEHRWPASDEESSLLLDSRLKTVH